MFKSSINFDPVRFFTDSINIAIDNAVNHESYKYEAYKFGLNERELALLGLLREGKNIRFCVEHDGGSLHIGIEWFGHGQSTAPNGFRILSIADIKFLIEFIGVVGCKIDLMEFHTKYEKECEITTVFNVGCEDHGKLYMGFYVDL